MPSTPHEVMVETLRSDPSLLGALVERLKGRALPSGLSPVDSTVRFVKTAEVRPDLLLAAGTKSWAIVEIQNKPDRHKRRRWLLAASVLFDQTRALGDVLVITARRQVARWALTVAHVESAAGTKLALTPVVLYLGPREVNALLDEARPDLAFLAAWAMQHRFGPKAKAVVDRAVDVTRRLAEPLQEAQMNAILSVLSRKMLALFEEIAMDPVKIQFSPAARAFKERMEARGEARGRAEGKHQALLSVLGARGLSVTAEQQKAIEACADSSVLDAWITKAVTAGSVAEVLAAPAAARATRGSATKGRKGAAPKAAARHRA